MSREPFRQGLFLECLRGVGKTEDAADQSCPATKSRSRTELGSCCRLPVGLVSALWPDDIRSLLDFLLEDGHERNPTELRESQTDCVRFASARRWAHQELQLLGLPTKRLLAQRTGVCSGGITLAVIRRDGARPARLPPTARLLCRTHASQDQSGAFVILPCTQSGSR